METVESKRCVHGAHGQALGDSLEKHMKPRPLEPPPFLKDLERQGVKVLEVLEQRDWRGR